MNKKNVNREYDAVVVGGGAAGLTCAAYLSRYGYRTLLCEKSAKTGGLVNTFWRNDFAFDGGIRAFENSGILFPMLKSLGIDIEFISNPVSIGIGDRMVKVNAGGGLESYVSMLTSLFPDNASDISQIAEEIRKVMGYMDVLYGIDNPLFLENMRDREYLMKTLLPWLLRYQVNIRKASRLSEPVNEYLTRFTQNRALIDMITQHFFKNTPTFFALSYFGLYLDYSYPKGGTGVLAQKLAEYILSAGGEIMTETAVTCVDSQKNQIETAAGDIYRYGKLIWAADQSMLYSVLSGQSTPQTQRQSRLAEKGSGGDSIISVFAGVNIGRDYFEERCSAHTFFTPSRDGLSSLSDWKEAAEKGNSELYEWVAKYLDLTTYEISLPAMRNPSLAPEGMTGVIVSTLMDYRLVRHISDINDYEAFKEFCSKKIIAVLGKSVFPGISKNILFSLCATPLTIERETGNKQGAITGWAFSDGTMPAENRFKKVANSVKTPIKDVFQCGQWSFSPSGLPISILTGKLAADAVRKTLKGAKNGNNHN